MQTLKNYLLQKDQTKLLFNSITGGYLTYMPLEGSVRLFSKYKDSTQVLNTPYFNYYKNLFGTPDLQILSFKKSKNVVSNFVVFDELPANDSEFLTSLQQAGLSLSQESIKLNNKNYFQKFVQNILGQEYSTKPILLNKGQERQELVNIVAEFLAENKKIVVKIADEFVCSMGADHIAIITGIDEFEKYLKDVFEGPEHGRIHILQDDILKVDLVIETFIAHIYSPSVTFYLHQDNVELLSINNQVLNNGSFIASTNHLSPGLNNFTEELTNLVTKLATEAHKLGARGFIGFDTIITKQENKTQIVIVEANYRTTGSTVPKITADKAVRYTSLTEWFYIASYYYNDFISDLDEMIDTLSRLNVLYQPSDMGNLDKEVKCIITLGERTKRCGLCFIWQKDSLSVEQINNQIVSILKEIHYPLLQQGFSPIA